MTFMLDDFDPASVHPARGPDVQPTTFGQGLSAATSQSMRNTNANFLRQRQVIGERDNIAGQAAERLGLDGMRPIVEAYNTRAQEAGLVGREIDMGIPVSDMAQKLGPNGSKEILEAARAAAATNPDAWADVDLTDEGIEARVTARRMQEDRDETQILDMMPAGRSAAELVGGTVGAVADVRNLPFMFAGGGGGNLLRVMGREAFWGGVAEAVTLPSQYEVAEELEKLDPNPLAAITFGMIGGAAIGGAVEGAGRAYRYYQGRGSVSDPLPGVDAIDSDRLITVAEDAITEGRDPLDAVQRMVDEEIEFTTDFDLDEIFGAAAEVMPPTAGRQMEFQAPRTETAIPVAPGLPRLDVSAPTERTIRYNAARDIDPEAFAQLEARMLERDAARQELEQATGQRTTDVDDTLAAMRTRRQQLLDAHQTARPREKPRLMSQIREVEDDRRLLLEAKGETTEGMTAARRRIIAADEAMRDLGPRLSAAYAQVPSEAGNITAAWRTFSLPQEPRWVPTFPLRRVRPADSVTAPSVASGRAMESAAPVARPAALARAMNDVQSSEARALHDQIEGDLRDQIARDGDFTVRSEEGDKPRPMSATAILDDLQRAEAFNDVLDACALPGRAR